ncbi:MAG: hypothetical protein KHX03_03910 [Clostridium sp.]|nr:hypothetical protein [Clostridium sp.]
MSLGITLNTNRNYIDTSSVNEVAKQIFQNAESKSFDINNTVDLSKFRRPEVGIDLYSQRTNLDTSRQVAVRNAGLDINLNENFIANVQYLNTMAAMNTEKVQKNVEGKLIAPVAEGEKSEVKNIFNLPGTIELSNSKTLDKDKRGSNPFSFFSMNSNKGREKQEEKVVNIFA